MLSIIGNIITPSPDQWAEAVHGMRHAYKATEVSDSDFCYGDVANTWEPTPGCEECQYHEYEKEDDDITEKCNKEVYSGNPIFALGFRDLDLLRRLVETGASDRKVLRQLPIILEVNAPLYWWKQADKYQIGTVTNSESTMHTIAKYPFVMEDFSIDALEAIDEPCKCGTYANVFKAFILDDLNVLRDYHDKAETDKEKELIRRAMCQLLPESYMQKRTWSLNYEVALNIILQRYDHPLTEWHELIQCFIDQLPYMKFIIEAVGYTYILRKKGYKLN